MKFSETFCAFPAEDGHNIGTDYLVVCHEDHTLDFINFMFLSFVVSATCIS